jgi:hypothetical protein
MRALILIIPCCCLLTGCVAFKPGTDKRDGGADAATPFGGGQPCIEVFSESFERGVDAWTTWAKCAHDSDWEVRQVADSAPGGGNYALRLHTSGLQPGCPFPGTYAISPAVAAEPGATYRAEGLTRNGQNRGATLIAFYDNFDSLKELSAYNSEWATGPSQYHSNLPAIGTAPSGTTAVRVRFGLNAGNADADVDLVRVTQVKKSCD